MENVSDTDDLVGKLNQLYPALANKKYIIAVDKQVVTGNTALTNSNVVALLPPFSGG